jgi:hypothetical protein
MQDSSSTLGNSGVMGNEHHGPALFLLKADNQIENSMSVFAVEITGGFISEKHRRLVSETPGDRDSLPLATGKFRWKVIEALVEADQLQ